MATQLYATIRDNLKQLYLDDPRPWLVGFSGGKDSSMVASLTFEHAGSLRFLVAAGR